jgi:hypothetical protein
MKVEFHIITIVVGDEPWEITGVGEEAERICKGRLGVCWTSCSHIVDEVGLDALFGAGIDKEDVSES